MVKKNLLVPILLLAFLVIALQAVLGTERSAAVGQELLMAAGGDDAFLLNDRDDRSSHVTICAQIFAALPLPVILSSRHPSAHTARFVSSVLKSTGNPRAPPSFLSI